MMEMYSVLIVTAACCQLLTARLVVTMCDSWLQYATLPLCCPSSFPLFPNRTLPRLPASLFHSPRLQSVFLLKSLSCSLLLPNFMSSFPFVHQNAACSGSPSRASSFLSLLLIVSFHTLMESILQMHLLKLIFAQYQKLLPPSPSAGTEKDFCLISVWSHASSVTFTSVHLKRNIMYCTHKNYKSLSGTRLKSVSHE